MNNEFLWRNQMRKLGEAAEPAHDLWPAIAARIAVAEPEARVGGNRRTLHWFALAASLVLAIGAALVALRAPHVTEVTQTAAVAVQTPAAQMPVAAEPATAATASVADLPPTALDWAQPSDPVLAATAAHLDIASAELQDALEQRPDAVFLVGLLNRTNAMRLRLMRKAPNAG
jgi:hypothetical protein